MLDFVARPESGRGPDVPISISRFHSSSEANHATTTAGEVISRPSLQSDGSMKEVNYPSRQGILVSPSWRS